MHYDIGTADCNYRPRDSYLINISRIINYSRLINASRRVGVCAPMSKTDGLRLRMVRTRAMDDGGDVTRCTYGGLG
jgi:hypothetical protein